MSLISALSDIALYAGAVTAVASIPVSAVLRNAQPPGTSSARDRLRAFRWFSGLAGAGVTLILLGLALAGNWPGAIPGAVLLAAGLAG